VRIVIPDRASLLLHAGSIPVEPEEGKGVAHSIDLVAEERLLDHVRNIVVRRSPTFDQRHEVHAQTIDQPDRQSRPQIRSTRGDSPDQQLIPAPRVHRPCPARPSASLARPRPGLSVAQCLWTPVSRARAQDLERGGCRIKKPPVSLQRHRRVGTRAAIPVFARVSGGISEGRARDGPLHWPPSTHYPHATAVTWQRRPGS